METQKIDNIWPAVWQLMGQIKKGLDEGSRIDIKFEVKLTPPNEINPPTGTGSDENLTPSGAV